MSAREQESERFDLAWPAEPDRIVRGRIVRPEPAAGPTGDGGPHPVVVTAHGFTSFMDWGFWPELSKRLAATGIASLRLNFSGSGVGPDLTTFTEPERFAVNTYVDELRDLDLVHDRLAAGGFRGLDPARMGIVGHSRGGAMALVHAAEHQDYRAVATWAAMDRILQFTPERLLRWRRDGSVEVWHWTGGRKARLCSSVLEAAERNRARLDVLAACARLRCPVLVAMGTEDRGLPFAVAENLCRAIPPGLAELLRVDRGDHTFGARHPLRTVTPELDLVLSATVAHFARDLSR